MSATNRMVTGSERVPVNRLWRRGAIAAVAAPLANLLVFFLVPWLFNFALEIPVMGPGSPIGPLPPFMVVLSSFVPAVGATLLLAVLRRFTARPVILFRGIALGFLLLSFIAPLTLPVPLNVRLTLASMHVVAAAVITYVLTAQPRQK